MPDFLDGHHIIVPTSISSTGAGNSSTINSNGSVTFSTCATLSLNGVFTSSYDNYMIVMRHSSSSAAIQLNARLRDSTPNDESGSNYTNQYLFASSTSVTGARETSQTSFRVGASSSTVRSGDVVYLYGPHLAQPTVSRNVNAMGADSGRILDASATHSLSTSYVGITFITEAGTFTGLVCVYGMVK